MADEQGRTLRTETMETLGLDARKLAKAKYKELTEIQRARLLKVRPELLARMVISLTPSKPSTSKGFLIFFSSPMVLCDPESDLAVFSSSFQGPSFPGVQVEFSPIKKNKTHLVEFHLSLHHSTTYKFRVFSYPLGTFQDVTVSGNQVLTALVPPLENLSSYGAAIQQRNAPGDDAGWTFYKVRVTSVA